ncbi:UNVERIFIED_CONTAM: Prostasin, partial [Eudyptes robustus]
AVRFPPGTNCTVTGWGDIRTAGPLPPPKTLQQLEVPLLSHRRCRCLYAGTGGTDGPGTPAGDTLCAGFPQGQRDACQVGATIPSPGGIVTPRVVSCPPR